METRTRLILEAAESLGIQAQSLHPDGNVFRLYSGERQVFLANGRGDWLGQAEGLICQDKGFQYELAKDLDIYPRSQSFLDPFVGEEYQEYVHFHSYEEIVAEIESSFDYPVIIKPNRGSRGNLVSQCISRDEVLQSVQMIFDHNSSAYDYVVLAQEYLDVRAEYRVICIAGKITLLIYKDVEQAEFVGNLSPLHWDGAVPRVSTDETLIGVIQAVLDPLFEKFPIRYVGLDVVLTQGGEWNVIEMNSHPGFGVFIEHNGESEVVRVYRELLSEVLS